MVDFTGLDLPASVTSRVELRPYEDIALAILRAGLPDVPVYSAIPPPGELVFPFILTHRSYGMENWSGDPRFTDSGRVLVSVFAEAPEGIEKAQYISEAIRIVMRDAWLNHVHFPDLGSVIRIEYKSEAKRSPDWATSAGPVQFADLPANITRYESEYKMKIRKPRS